MYAAFRGQDGLGSTVMRWVVEGRGSALFVAGGEQVEQGAAEHFGHGLTGQTWTLDL